MNAKVKEKWIEALTSGKYVQGKSRLRDPKNNTYCCLGVLCELYIEQVPISEETLKFWKEEGSFISNVMHYTAYPTDDVLEWAELGNRRKGNFSNISLFATMNDRGYTFEEIADYIKKTY